MGNKASKGSGKSRHPRQYLGHQRVPHEIQVAIAAHLCPHCSTGEDAILPTEEARKRQRDLGKLAVTCKYLNVVANEHRFHSFIMRYDPYLDRPDLVNIKFWPDKFQAVVFHNEALPELMERLIRYSRLRQDLHYLSIRDVTLTYKAGVTKSRLRLFISASRDHGIEVPSFVSTLLNLPEYTRHNLATLSDLRFYLDGELWIADGVHDSGRSKSFDAWMIRLLLFGLAPRLKKLLIDPNIATDVLYLEQPHSVTLPSVVSMVIPEPAGMGRMVALPADLRTELLLPSFPNLRTFQNHDPGLTAHTVLRDPDQTPSVFPNLRRLLLSGDQAGRQEHITTILRDFPQLEELHHHRIPGLFSNGDPSFCNADMFNGVHHCLRKLTYSSAWIDLESHPFIYNIDIKCFAEPRFTDVPHFGAFAVLEELKIDQALLGRMSTIRDRIESPIGPSFPDLAWKLPQSLHRLAVHFVYDWPQLACQLATVTLAKDSGQFPHLRDIDVVLVRSTTLTYNYTWVPHIPLLPAEDLTRTTGEMLQEAGIDLWVRNAAIGPPPGELEHYPREAVPPRKPINFVVRQVFFPDP